MEPIAPAGGIVPSVLPTVLFSPLGAAPKSPLYPSGESQAVSPHEHSPKVLYFPLRSIQYCLAALVALTEFSYQLTPFLS